MGFFTRCCTASPARHWWWPEPWTHVARRPSPQMIADAIRSDLAKFTVFDDCGHGPHNEQAEQTMALRCDFILE
jgi:hypothetical protein